VEVLRGSYVLSVGDCSGGCWAACGHDRDRLEALPEGSVHFMPSRPFSKNGRKEFFRREDGHGGTRKVLGVSRDDGSHSGGPGRLVQDRILVVRKARVEGANKDPAIDWSNLEHGQEFADLFLRLPRTYHLRGKVVDGRDGRCAEHALDASLVGETKELGGDFGERFSGEEHIEQHVRVEKDLHRCLASRWRL